MPAIPLVAVWTLDKDGAITQALGKYLPSDVVEPNSSSCKQRKTGAFIQWAASYCASCWPDQREELCGQEEITANPVISVKPALPPEPAQETWDLTCTCQNVQPDHWHVLKAKPNCKRPTGCLQMMNDCEATWSCVLPMCLRVISTVAFLLTLDSRPRQKRSELDGSVNPSTVSEGWEAWKVSPTRWFSS